jgi:hypothetical protein
MLYARHWKEVLPSLSRLVGAKDSHAMIHTLPSWFRAQGYTGELYAIHADLGRMEWSQTYQIVQQHAAAAAISLVVVNWKGGDLVDRIEQRMEQLAGTGKPFVNSRAIMYQRCSAKGYQGYSAKGYQKA